MTRLDAALRMAEARGVARLEAQLLLLHVLGRNAADRAWLIAHDNDPLPPGVDAAFDEAVARRLGGEPVAYITGKKEFFGLELSVDRRVLDPRPDTETVVQWALDALATLAPGPTSAPHPVVLDLGTGSGAIALALQRQRPDAQVWAVDASADALAVARGNAQRLDLAAVNFLQGSWFDPLAPGLKFDVVVSNPPYVRSDDPHLAALRHEPLSALASGTDGLADIRQIIAQAPGHLRGQGWLLLEHGYDQAEAVRQLLRTHPGWTEIQSRKDLAGIERCTGARWQSAG